jgi:hypothetical protein
VLAGDSANLDGLTVNQGLLRLTGNLGMGPISVATAATLTGDGQFHHAFVSGTLAPGTTTDPYGALISGGPLTTYATTLTCFNADATGANSSLFVEVASLNGDAWFTFHGAPPVGTAYTVVSSFGLVGQFGAWGSNLANVDGVFTYGTSQATFTVTADDAIFRAGFENTVVGAACAAAFTQ